MRDLMEILSTHINIILVVPILLLAFGTIFEAIKIFLKKRAEDMYVSIIRRLILKKNLEPLEETTYSKETFKNTLKLLDDIYPIFYFASPKLNRKEYEQLLDLFIETAHLLPDNESKYIVEALTQASNIGKQRYIKKILDKAAVIPLTSRST